MELVFKLVVKVLTQYKISRPVSTIPYCRHVSIYHREMSAQYLFYMMYVIIFRLKVE